MPEGVTKELIQSLAMANGLQIPEERLELVLRQYQSFLRTLEQLDSLALEMEAEPATVFSVSSGSSTSSARR